MPQLLPRPISILPVGCIPLRDLRLKLGSIPNGGEVDGFWCSEDVDLFGEVAVVGVVKRVLDEVADEHLRATWRIAFLFEIIGSDALVAGMFRIRNVGEGELFAVNEVDPIFWLVHFLAPGSGGSEGRRRIDSRGDSRGACS